MSIQARCPFCVKVVKCHQAGSVQCPYCNSVFEVVDHRPRQDPSRPRQIHSSEGSGCLIWAVVLAVLFLLAFVGGGGIFGSLLGIVLGLLAPVAIGVFAILVIHTFSK